MTAGAPTGPALHVLPGGADEAAAETALAHALVAGRPEAQQAAWTRFAPMVHGTIARSIGRNDDAADLTQDVFVRVFERIHTLRDPTALRSFVFSIAVRVIRAELRRRWVRRIVRPLATREPQQAPDLWWGNGPGSDGARADAREALRRFYGSLDTLGGRERTAYVLRHVEGLRLEEAAEALGVSLATFKRVLARGSVKMDALMRADEVLATYYAREEGRDHGA